jgi:hypothetical protein
MGGKEGVMVVCGVIGLEIWFRQHNKANTESLTHLGCCLPTLLSELPILSNEAGAMRR